MIVGPNGEQVSDGPTGRKITLEERIIKGKRVFVPDIQGQFKNVLEIPKILAMSIEWVCKRMEEELTMSAANEQLKTKLQELEKEEGK